jgi:hypothetical protein
LGQLPRGFFVSVVGLDKKEYQIYNILDIGAILESRGTEYGIHLSCISVKALAIDYTVLILWGVKLLDL